MTIATAKMTTERAWAEGKRSRWRGTSLPTLWFLLAVPRRRECFARKVAG